MILSSGEDFSAPQSAGLGPPPGGRPGERLRRRSQPPAPAHQTEPAKAEEGTLLALLPRGSWLSRDEETLAPSSLIVSSMIEMMSMAEAMKPALLLLDAGQLQPAHAAWLVHLRQLIPTTALALASSREDFSRTAGWALRLGVQMIYPLFGWREAPDWPLWRCWAQRGRAEGALEAILGARAEHVDIALDNDGREPIAAGPWLGFVKSLRLTREAAYDFQLCAEELVNNAFCHGASRLGPGAESSPHVEVRLGVGGGWYGLRVRDSGGRLARHRVLASLGRQWGADGILDEQGRGLYLAHTLAARLVFSVQPGLRTDVTLLFRPRDAALQPGAPLHPIGVFDPPRITAHFTERKGR